MPERSYTEREVARIIEIAAERQRGGAGPAEPGLTLDEIERIGRESGIDPAHLRAAARLLDATEGSRAVEDDGKNVVVRRTLRGPVSDAQWAVFADELAHVYGPSSDIGERIVRTFFPARPLPEGVREWRDKQLDTATSARASEAPDGTTRIKLRRRVSAISPWIDAGLFGGIIALVMGGLGAAGAAAIGAGGLWPLWAMLLVLAASFIVAAPALLARDRRARRRESARMSRIADELALRVAGPPERAPEAADAGRLDPSRLDPSLLDAEPPDAADPLADDARPPHRDRSR